MADGRRLEEPARELVEERLEGVVVVAVDEHDLGVSVLELLGRADPGEASAEDQDAWTLRAHVVPPSRPQFDVVDSSGASTIRLSPV